MKSEIQILDMNCFHNQHWIVCFWVHFHSSVWYQKLMHNPLMQWRQKELLSNGRVKWRHEPNFEGMFWKGMATIGIITSGFCTCHHSYMVSNCSFLLGILVGKFTTCHFWTLRFWNEYTQRLTNSFALTLETWSNNIPIYCHLDNIQLLIFQWKSLNIMSHLYKRFI